MAYKLKRFIEVKKEKDEHRKYFENKLKLGKWQILWKYFQDYSLCMKEYRIVFGVVKYHSIPSEGELMYGNRKLYKGWMGNIRYRLPFISFKW